ncbi:MAG: tetratricopeptide repeat-containing diguanylate cyclase [Colwellia sp.]
MLCFSKKTSQAIKIITSIFCFLIPVGAAAQDEVAITIFSQVAEQVKELKKTDLALSLLQLTTFEKRLDTLTIEQKTLYFKLLAEIQIEQNKYSAAKKSASQGLTIAKGLASPTIFMSELLYLKGFAYERLGDVSLATKEYKKGLEVAESLHNKVKIASGLIKLGTIAYLSDDFKRALILLNDAYNIARQTNDEELKGRANRELGVLYSHLQQDVQSMAYYQQSYLHFKKARLLLAAHSSLIHIATTHIRNKNYQQAITVFKTIIAESNKDTPSDSLFTVYSGMARAYLKKEDSNPEVAYQYLLKAKAYLQSTENSDYRLQFYIDEANILYELKRFDDVLISIAHVEKILGHKLDIPRVKKENYLSMIDLKASAFYQQGKFSQAYKTKSRVIFLTEKAYENEDVRSITQVRLKLEAEQAEQENKILYNQQILYQADLHEANIENEAQRLYLVISALVALAFVWVIVKIVRSQHRLKIASNIDTLTGVENRRSLMRKSQEAFTMAKIKKTQLSLLMIDIDRFKDINDNLGHSLGDKVLAKIALLTTKMIRKSDIFGRFGSDEFMICLPNTDLQSAMNIAERMRSCVNEHSWRIANLEKVSVSVGVVCLVDDNDLISIIKRAEEKLYQAQASGRNKVCG